MNSAAIHFQFPDARSAALAFDTLQELGYEPVRAGQSAPSILHVHVDHRDLTSALEIAQAHGGSLMDSDDACGTYDSAYDMDTIRIPAHLVNEDWADDSDVVLF